MKCSSRFSWPSLRAHWDIFRGSGNRNERRRRATHKMSAGCRKWNTYFGQPGKATAHNKHILAFSRSDTLNKRRNNSGKPVSHSRSIPFRAISFRFAARQSVCSAMRMLGASGTASDRRKSETGIWPHYEWKSKALAAAQIRAQAMEKSQESRGRRLNAVRENLEALNLQKKMQRKLQSCIILSYNYRWGYRCFVSTNFQSEVLSIMLSMPC